METVLRVYTLYFTTSERQFEERLNSLILLKALLIKDNEFDEVAQKEYHEAWERVFDLLE